MRKALIAVLLIVGVLAIAAGVVYLTQPGHSIPSFFPGYGAHVHGKYQHRGEAGIGFGALLIVIALVVAVAGMRRRGGAGRGYWSG